MRKDILLHLGALAILLLLELLGIFSDYHQGNFARILVLAAYGIGSVSYTHLTLPTMELV